MKLNDVSGEIIDAALGVHSFLGPGLLESSYEVCLASALRRRGLAVESQVPLMIEYEGVRLDCAYRLDLVVEQRVVVEIKAVNKLLSVHEAQVLSYIKLGKFELGLLLNFHEEHLRDGIRRMINQMNSPRFAASSANSVVKRSGAERAD